MFSQVVQSLHVVNCFQIFLPLKQWLQQLIPKENKVAGCELLSDFSTFKTVITTKRFKSNTAKQLWIAFRFFYL